jgi:predicted peptidase
MRIDSAKFGKMNYLACFPNDFCEGKKYPVIIHLHGAGSRGNDVEVLKKQSIIQYAQSSSDFPFVMFLPQCNAKYWEDVYEQLKALIYHVKELSFIDPERIFLSGVSMGGIASWHLLISENHIFQKAIICCGAGMYWRLASVKAKVWAFHGTEDLTAVPYDAGKKMIDEMKRLGKEIKFTAYEGMGHNILDITYSNPEIYQWLLS